MRKNVGNLLFGCVFILLGGVFVGNAMGWWHLSLFFSGWWTLFLIVPAIISIARDGFRVWNCILLVVGGLLLLSMQNILSFHSLRKLIFPIILILVGLGIVFRGMFRNAHIPRRLTDGTNRPSQDYTACFSGREEVYPPEEFHGCSVMSIFGGTDLDLRQAIITQDVYISVTSVFGGSDILLPMSCNVKVSSTPIFGGTDNHRRHMAVIPGAPTVFVNSTAIFGGTDIK